MKTFLLFFSFFSISFCYEALENLEIPIGKENVELKLASGNVKVITRVLEGSTDVQKWNIAKKTWVDSKGQIIPSSNYSFKAPGTIIIKNVTKADAGFYDFVMVKDVTEVQKNLPDGVFVDVEPMRTGIELKVE